ncbi:MAG: glutamate mutase L [Fimbriimonadales bacterium]|jgi:uncharacterized protein (TIGR01319 family)|nr:glutamate mutase L [Fimbriimonadales bacterium]GBC89669.1 hypothetical protein HRbin14_00395 [bacterium HR14]GIV12082.1 MAG: hypothetical protein KatS3mg021_0364 [Fimbriimonadales bacterium]CUU05122.1 conserved hypothetical protein [Armatimonadetes bacterium GBS]CUU36343.1 conserved hypothetical protein [Armatimonadetes bacterium GXS]
MAEVRSILATDCGSTTTKAILIEKQGDEYRLVNRGEAPTTVEAPFDDVTIGVLNAVRELEDLTGRQFIQDGKILTPQVDDKRGVDLYLSTSSAGGGLQMMVMGVVRQMSAESAQRAALGAGAIIMDVIAIDDGRKDYQKIQRLRELRPDIVLLSGGTDGGTITHLVELAELLIAADPRPRFGTMNLPVIFAGNKDAREEIKRLLGERFDLRIVDNLRPTLDRENLGPAREAIHELFLEHVMQQAPGYSKLMSWTSADIMSTPNAVGKIMVTIAEQRGINILGVDIGGATTDVFSVFDGNYTRTVSANLGMSYSICNVMLEAGIANIRKWLPFDIEEYEVRNRLRNKMIRPTTIPQTYHDLLLEQAVAREALRLAFQHHKQLARGLKGVQQQRTIGEALEQTETGKSLVEMMKLDMIVGSGGVLSHAPRRAQAALMMMDAYQPEGVTMLAVDSIFMMPQLGVLSTVHPQAAAQVFDRDCLIRLGSCIAPVGQARPGEPVLTMEYNGKSETFRYGEIRVLPMGVGETMRVMLKPARGFDVGAGKGRAMEAVVEGGVVGLIVDTRGRPLQLPQNDAERRAKLIEWLRAFGLPEP